jgi:transcriptional regulator with XRE-family HTH domain
MNAPIPTNTLGTLGKRLAWARANAGLSCAQAATMIAVTRDTIVYAEQDRITLHQATLTQLATAYDARLDWLIDGKEPDVLPAILGKIDVTPGYTLAPEELHEIRLMLWRSRPY